MSDIDYSNPNNTPPIGQAIPLGLQHVLAMFASNVTPSIIVAGAAGTGLWWCRTNLFNPNGYAFCWNSNVISNNRCGSNR